MSERLTRKDKLDTHYRADEVFYENGKPRFVYGGKVIDKLGQLEDIFEKHNVNWEALDELLTILEQGGMVALRNGTFYRINIAEPDFKGCAKVFPLKENENEKR